MHPRVLINSKWKTHRLTTGVQRYAHDLTNALSDAGLEFEERSPMRGMATKSILWEQHTLPKLARDFDTLFCPANMAPISLRDDVRLIVTVHCLRFHFHPENYSRSFARWYRFMIPRIIARADVVLTVSQTAADEIRSVYPESIGKVEVVYAGVSESFRPDGVRGDDAISPGAYWVFVGNASPTKNLKVLFKAMQHSDQPHRLVLLGVDESQLNAMGVAYPQGRVIPLGHVNDTSRVAAILRGASGLLSPSLYESFDLPTIEAMACGCPVIASDTLVHREIGQDGPIYVSPTDSVQWGAAIDQSLHDSAAMELRIANGIERASSFRWVSSATQIMNIIQNLGPESPNS